MQHQFYQKYVITSIHKKTFTKKQFKTPPVLKNTSEVL